MYDPARDTFTNSDDKPDDTSPTDERRPSAPKSSQSPGSGKKDAKVISSSFPKQNSSNAPIKRKRSQSPSKPQKPSHKATSNTPPEPKAEPDTKRHKPSPQSNTSPPDPPASAAPKPITAGSLSQISIAKKPVSERVQKPKPNEKRRERPSTNRRRSRSPQRSPAQPIQSDRGRREPRSPAAIQARQKLESPPPIARSPSRSPPRQRKRPGAGARVSAADAQAVRRRQQEREQAQVAQSDAAQRGINDVVRQHYNAVPQRGREWRSKDSMIKGLRTFNNWVKSAVIQKFSPNEDYTPGAQEYGMDARDRQEHGLVVLDMGCGKGGDLQKWQNAPQKVDLYIGLDPADVSIDQAQGRYRSMPRWGRGELKNRRLFDAQFLIKDCFGEWLGDMPIIRQVGIDPTIGPEGAPGSKWGGGKFDVISMMFSMHYAFESEEKARMMLRNVAGCLKKGGRFVGVIPNSDVLSAKVKQHFIGGTATKTGDTPGASGVSVQNGANDNEDEDWDPEKPVDAPAQGQPTQNDSDEEWDPEKPSDPTTNGTAPRNNDSDSDWDCEKPTVSTPAMSPSQPSPTDPSPQPTEPLEWGNSLYTIHFPAASLPKKSKNTSEFSFRPPWGHKYFFRLQEAVEQLPEYVVPWETLRALAVEFNLELRWKRGFQEVWKEESEEPGLRELSFRMGVRDRDGGLGVSKEEWEAIGFYHAFCFYKV